jgi:hypothetical protein
MTSTTATTWSLPYSYRPRSVHSFCGTESEILPLQWRQRQAVSLVAQQQRKPSLVSWELAAGPVPCSDRRRVSLEPAVQSRTEMLQKSALKIYLLPRNLGSVLSNDFPLIVIIIIGNDLRLRGLNSLDRRGDRISSWISKSSTISDARYMGRAQSALLLSPSLLLEFYLLNGRRYGDRTFTTK